MTRIGPLTLARKAVKRIEAQVFIRGEIANTVVAAVVEELAEPDRLMIAAGEAEIALALPPGTRKAYRKDLARGIWRTMLARVTT